MSTIADEDRPVASGHDGQGNSATLDNGSSIQCNDRTVTSDVLETPGQNILHSMSRLQSVEEDSIEDRSDEPSKHESVFCTWSSNIDVVQTTLADSDSSSLQTNVVARTLNPMPMFESDSDEVNAVDDEPSQNDFSGTASDIEALDTEILKFEKMRRLLREVRNRHEPTSRSHLPNEVLIRIFFFCSDIRPGVDEEDQQRGFMQEWSCLESCPHHVRHWFIVSHVCRQWRWVALTKPALWSTISISWGPLWIREAARRAQTSESLILHPGVGPFEYRLPAAPRHVKAVNDVLERVSELHIELESHNISALNIFGAPAPRLEKLNVVIQGGAVQAAGPILGQHAPELSSLTLDGVLFTNLNDPTWTNIVDIHLCNTARGDNICGNVYQTDIIKALAQMPSLKIVEIRNVPALENRNKDPPLLKIEKMSHLTLTGYVYWVAVMLRSLRPDPGRVVINLETDTFARKREKPMKSDSFSIFPVIVDLFKSESVQFAKLDLAVYSWDSRFLSFKAWTKGNDCGPNFALVWEVSLRRQPSISKAVVSILPKALNEVQEICLSMSYSWTQKKWNRFLRCAGNVRELHVTATMENLERLISGFSTSAIEGRKKSTDPKAEFVCSKLHKLVLHVWASEKRVDDSMTTVSGGPGESVWPDDIQIEDYQVDDGGFGQSDQQHGDPGNDDEHGSQGGDGSDGSTGDYNSNGDDVINGDDVSYQVDISEEDDGHDENGDYGGDGSNDEGGAGDVDDGGVAVEPEWVSYLARMLRAVNSKRERAAAGLPIIYLWY
ncbi:hypothetical protein FA95DRAFT_1637405 [Auriscalpium vulgare]|uniref:Uncharacterized protein n=1 Tax=Auriscalpium vulgare TaxID=40419 RepID=A0ACB8RDM7_9AGAM|nr:hypothetical protein FA95DRAFT_1637405 [Auriscalpium vulgare]